MWRIGRRRAAPERRRSIHSRRVLRQAFVPSRATHARVGARVPVSRPACLVGSQLAGMQRPPRERRWHCFPSRPWSALPARATSSATTAAATSRPRTAGLAPWQGAGMPSRRFRPTRRCCGPAWVWIGRRLFREAASAAATFRTPVAAGARVHARSQHRASACRGCSKHGVCCLQGRARGRSLLSRVRRAAFC